MSPIGMSEAADGSFDPEPEFVEAEIVGGSNDGGDPVSLTPLQLCRYTSTQMLLPDGLDYDQWYSIGTTLKQMERSINFWLGDWLRYGERRYGEKYTQAVLATGLAEQTLQNNVWVCNAIEPSRRRENLPFGHHAAVAALPPLQQDEVLARAESEHLSVKDTRIAALRVKATLGDYKGMMFRVNVQKALQQPYDAVETPSLEEAKDTLLEVVKSCLETGLVATVDLVTQQGRMPPGVYRRVTTGTGE